MKGNMRSKLLTRLPVVALVAVAESFIFVADVEAQVRCPEGRTVAGQCVNAPLASGMRQTSIVFSQPKISQTAYPVLPVLDFIYRYPHQLTQVPTFPTPIAGPPIP